jgi:hypothetical protein
MVRPIKLMVWIFIGNYRRGTKYFCLLVGSSTFTKRQVFFSAYTKGFNFEVSAGLIHRF